MLTTTTIRLKSKPLGVPTASNFEFFTRKIPSLKDGEVLLKSLYISVDPYIRPRLYLWSKNTIITSPQIAQVIKVKNTSRFNVGDVVAGKNALEWSTYSITKATNCVKLPNDWQTNSKIDLTHYMGPLGGTGRTAYYGLLDIGQLKEGENVFVSGAAGATGSVCGQIAKNIKRCYVVGTAGTNTKCDWLTNELGFDIALNYKDYNNDSSKFALALRKAFPNGIDVYFDNTGGFQTAAIWDILNVRARVVICGQIANYNNFLNMPKIDDFLFKTIYKNIRIEGFVVSDFKRHQEFHTNMVKWICNGKIKSKQTMRHGLNNVPQSFIGLFSGENIGKMLVKVSDPDNVNTQQSKL